MSWAAIAQGSAPAAPAAQAPLLDTSGKDVRIAVVDANAIISGIRLDGVADKAVTIPEVLNEIRDKQSRQFLTTLPFGIDVHEPTEESLAAVKRFARETGDIHALSAVDIKLLALAHTLELQLHGPGRVRDHPAAPRLRTKHRSSAAKALPGWGAVPNPEDWKVIDDLNDLEEHEAAAAAAAGAVAGAAAAEAPAAAGSRIAQTMQQLDLSGGLDAVAESAAGSSGAAAAGQAPAAGAGSATGGAPSAGPGTGPAAAEEEEEEEVEEEEGGQDDGWEVVASSRTAARRTKRKQLRREAIRKEFVAEWTEVAGPPAPPTASGPAGDATAGAVNGPGAAAEAGAASGAPPPPEAVAGAQPPSSAPNGSRAEPAGDDTNGDEAASQGSRSSEGQGEGEEAAASEDEDSDSSSDGEDSGEGGAEEGSSAGAGSEAAAGAEDSRVASVTADFAMQNVLLQMGLRLLAPDGRQITRLSRWALRCSACFAVTREAGRIFCPKCGNNALDRVEVTVGPDGTQLFGVRKKHCLRGTRYSLPKPKGGRNSTDPVLREDVFLLKARALGGRRGSKPKRAEDDGGGTGVLDDTPAPGGGSWARTQKQLAEDKGLTKLAQPAWKTNPNDRHGAHRTNRRK